MITSGLDGYFGMTQAMEGDMRFGVWNVSSLNMLCSLTAAARDLTSYKLDLVCVCVFMCVCVCAGGYMGQRGHSKSMVIFISFSI
jgi:hypothetical protein